MLCHRLRIRYLFFTTIIASTLTVIILPTILKTSKYTANVGDPGASSSYLKDTYRVQQSDEEYPLQILTADYTPENGMRCNKYPWLDPDGVFYLRDDEQQYFRKTVNGYCFVAGTDFTSRSGQSNATICRCLQGWNGRVCSIPDTVQQSNIGGLTALERIKPRVDRAPRRLIHAFPFNNEFELLEARLAEYYDVVDVFMILESNYTAYGRPKPLRLLNRLRLGYFRKYSCKILHIFLDYFPDAARRDGWIIDNLLRNYLGQHGLKYQLKNYQSDDLFFLTDADELPRRETLLFLKLHDGYPEPVGHFLSPHTYGFFWIGKRENMHIITTVSVGLLTQVLNHMAIYIRSASARLRNNPFLNAYLKAHPDAQIKLWSFGNSRLPSGWHCSWCCRPKCIKSKLISAQNGDFPRWGDYPEKRDLTYIKYLIKSGLWFDNISKMKPRTNDSKYYAPEHMLMHYDQYRYLLENPYKSTELNVSKSSLKPYKPPKKQSKLPKGINALKENLRAIARIALP